MSLSREVARARTLACVLGLLLACGACKAERRPAAAPLWQRPPGASTIDAAARFTGTQIVVTNRGRDLWRSVEISVGRDDQPPAFRYVADAVLGGREIAIGALNFERPDGTRLSPFQLQPDRWSLRVRLPGGESGFAEGRWP